MSMRRFIATICVVMLSGLLPAQSIDDRPATKEPQARLIALIELMAQENVATARINVVRDVMQRRLRILSTVSDGSGRVLKNNGFEVEIIYNANIGSAKSGVGSYRFQYNDNVLTFAGAEFGSGRKELARWLVGILTEAEPDLFWESATHPVATIKQIQAGLEKDDGTLREFVQDASQTWAEIVLRYPLTK